MTIEVIPNVLMKDIGIIPLFRVINADNEFDDNIIYPVRSRNDTLINQAHYIREKLKENPDAEFWDFLSYTSYKTQIKLFTSTVMVSTKGRIAYQLNDGVHISTGTLSGKYLQAHIETGLDINGKSYINIYIHRAVACTFLPKPEKYKDVDYSKLEANHLDGVKTNPHFLNLEWGTKSDNLKHAVKTGLIKSGVDARDVKPVLGTVIVDSKWKGTQFVLFGRTAISNLGLDPASIQQTVSGKAKATYGCSWEYISKEDSERYSKEIPEELLERMLNDKVSLLLTTKPLLATLEKDGVEYQCIFMGGKELAELGFQQAHISKVCSGLLKSHGGMKWKYIPLIEAEKLHRGLTPEMKQILNK